MTTLREAAQMALDALDIACRKYGDVGGAETDWGKWDAAMTALSARLAQPEQEPVAWKYETPAYVSLQWKQRDDWRDGTWTALYTTPQQREWQGLTDEEIWTSGSWIGLSDDGIRKFAREIEAKLKEKNT